MFVMPNYAAWVSAPLAAWWLCSAPPVPPPLLALHALLLLAHAPWYVEREQLLASDRLHTWCAAWVLGCFGEAGAFAARNTALVAASAAWFLVLLLLVPVPDRRPALACLGACAVSCACMHDVRPSVLTLLFVPVLAHPVPRDVESAEKPPCRVEYRRIQARASSAMHASGSESDAECGRCSGDFCMIGN